MESMKVRNKSCIPQLVDSLTQRYTNTTCTPHRCRNGEQPESWRQIPRDLAEKQRCIAMSKPERKQCVSLKAISNKKYSKHIAPSCPLPYQNIENFLIELIRDQCVQVHDEELRRQLQRKDADCAISKLISNQTNESSHRRTAHPDFQQNDDVRGHVPLREESERQLQIQQDLTDKINVHQQQNASSHLQEQYQSARRDLLHLLQGESAGNHTGDHMEDQSQPYREVERKPKFTSKTLSHGKSTKNRKQCRRSTCVLNTVFKPEPERNHRSTCASTVSQNTHHVIHVPQFTSRELELEKVRLKTDVERMTKQVGRCARVLNGHPMVPPSCCTKQIRQNHFEEENQQKKLPNTLGIHGHSQHFQIVSESQTECTAEMTATGCCYKKKIDLNDLVKVQLGELWLMSAKPSAESPGIQHLISLKNCDLLEWEKLKENLQKQVVILNKIDSGITLDAVRKDRFHYVHTKSKESTGCTATTATISTLGTFKETFQRISEAEEGFEGEPNRSDKWLRCHSQIEEETNIDLISRISRDDHIEELYELHLESKEDLVRVRLKELDSEQVPEMEHESPKSPKTPKSANESVISKEKYLSDTVSEVNVLKYRKEKCLQNTEHIESRKEKPQRMIGADTTGNTKGADWLKMEEPNERKPVSLQNNEKMTKPPKSKLKVIPKSHLSESGIKALAIRNKLESGFTRAVFSRPSGKFDNATVTEKKAHWERIKESAGK